MALLMKGAPVAAALCERTAARVRELSQQGITPSLAILRVGEDGGSLAYERSAVKRCEGLGIKTETAALPADAAEEALLSEIRRVNQSAEIHGCLLLRPLPGHMDDVRVCQALDVKKDVDGITAGSMSFVYSGRGEGFAPCTAEACLTLLDHYGIPLRGTRVAVIGRSLVVGRPLAMLLQARDATVTLCHSQTRELPALCREQDILISAAGHIGTVDVLCLREGQVILDVGTNLNSEGKLTGDVVFDRAEPLAGAITPVPGGVGAVTTAVLAAHVVQAAARQAFNIAGVTRTKY